MDNVNIEIESSSDKATSGVDKLIQTLSNLNSALSGIRNNINKYVQGMGKISNIGKKIKIPKVASASDKTQTQKEVDFLNSNAPSNIPKGNKSKKRRRIKSITIFTKRIRRFKWNNY